MTIPSSPETPGKLKELFLEQKLFRPLRIQRYESGQRLRFEMEALHPAQKMGVELEVVRFVGGGYSGQVYKVKVLRIERGPESPESLQAGGTYALKIFIPPGAMSRFIRDIFYAIGFQGPFSLRVNPAAVRAGALWQRFIRRGARLRFGSEDSVANVLATFIDSALGSCGEISEWIEGRTWRLEVDDNLYARLRWRPGQPGRSLNSPEYRAKKAFMSDLVKLMREMGAEELARQYEWGTLKSQPNALKRSAMDPDPDAGLTAVDFRAGLVLLPFLPECPADFKLIIRGIRRGSLVQFDRGDIRKLESYTAARPEAFSDMAVALEELKTADQSYRDSLPDLTHHHVKLITSPKLWRAIHDARVRGWEVRNMADAAAAGPLHKSGLATLLFLLLGLLPVLTPALFVLKFPGRASGLWLLWLAPLLGPFVRKLWGRRDFRRHVGAMLTAKGGYLGRTLRGHVAEALIGWQRSGRVSDRRALAIAARPGLYLLNRPLAFLPPGVHRFLTDKAYFKERLHLMFVKPFQLYFKPAVREKWLRDMVEEGKRNGILTTDEAARISAQINEPYIQKYLKSLAVHLATLFLSETVFLTIAVIYVLGHPELGWSEATLRAGLIIGALNLLPVSPGSLVRGFYVLGLCIKEKNIRDYWLALPVSFLKVFGYLAFPLQMAYRFPELARFMAGHWATEAVHIVPIFGEKGAWLEHAAFDLFYNYPLSLRRRIGERDARFSALRRRKGTIPTVMAMGALALALMDAGYLKVAGRMPTLGYIWWLAVWVPFLSAPLAAGLSRLPRLSRRLSIGALAGALLGLIHVGFGAALKVYLKSSSDGLTAGGQPWGQTVIKIVTPIILFAIIAILGVLLFENRRPSPQSTES
jgi:hypothetical protein